ncbi:MAG TPA: ThuA domain-containing protein [Propionibacteriaceae bacterium]|nr:ThuA domain-containing protein [Propionibacteriaceae bacterium]
MTSSRATASQQRILLFTKTTGYRHASIPEGVDLVQACARDNGVTVDHTENESAFNAPNLNRYDAVVWLQVLGDVLDGPGRSAFEAYLRAGGGYAGIHGASVAEPSWPSYESIVGARFVFHPMDHQFQTALVITELHDPSTAHLPQSWTWLDEWYSFERNPRGESEILLRIDESSYDPEDQPMGDDHPVSWRGRHGQGRTWYTALGHLAESYADPVFRNHIWGGITSVLR